MNMEEDFYVDLPALYVESLKNTKIYPTVSGPTVLAYSVLVVAVVYHMVHYFDYYPVLPICELAWNIFVYLTPSAVISVLDTRANGAMLVNTPGDHRNLDSRNHAVKSEAIRRIFGWDAGGMLGKIQQARSLPGIGKLLPGRPSDPKNIGPPGLGNWDNSCYQNSIIQGLASLHSLPSYLSSSVPLKDSLSTATALRTIITKLNNPSNIGLMLWTPVELKSMNSWQQQDAQEYFSKVLDEVEKEVAAGQREKQNHGGLACLSGQQDDPTGGFYRKRRTEKAQSMNIEIPPLYGDIDHIPTEIGSSLIRNPLEGLLAQRVGCLKCGYVEGLSLIPFNCLTVPLGKQLLYDIRTCLDDYTALEPISGVECVKCTLLHNKVQLERLHLQTHNSAQISDTTPGLTQALHVSIRGRLSALENALKDNDFSDSKILNKCQIPPKNRVSVTKSRQAVIARAPKSLVIHVNRSVFDEVTGVQRKNFADVKFPQQLDLTPWCLGSQTLGETDAEHVENWSIDPSKSMLFSPEAEDMAFFEIDRNRPRYRQLYNLRAVITHYGRHENGHYICYRKHRLVGKSLTDPAVDNAESWWRLSDEEVSSVSENTVLQQGGVFMLFYEKSDVAKDGILYLPRKQPPDLLDSSLMPDETTEIRNLTEDNYVGLETVMTDPLTSIAEERPVEIMVENHNSPFITKISPDDEVFNASEPKCLVQAQTDSTRISASYLSASISPIGKFPHSLKVSSSEDSTQERPAPQEKNPSAAYPENLLISASSSAEPSSPLPASETPLPTETSATEDIQNIKSPDIVNSTTDANSKSLPPEPCTTEDPPKESPKPNHHPPMRTASPRSSRGSVSRAGKAMGNVSTMVTAN
jgi:ubiquitin carboxyl-terminal hydrolase 1